MDKLALMKTANEIRKSIVTAVHAAKSGHPGGSLSAADIYTYLYFEEMNVDPADPKKADRDRFVLSKGHTAPGYYSALAHKGFFPVEDLTTLRHTGSYLQGHPDMKHIPGVDMSSGSLVLGIIGLVKGIVGVVVNVVNAIIRTLNKINFTVPDWVPALGGKQFGFNLTEVTLPNPPDGVRNKMEPLCLIEFLCCFN